MIQKLYKNRFLFEELVKRDFKKKYKKTVLGMLWSVLSPLLNLFVMSIVFTNFFGRNTPHYTIYLFAGNLIFSYFRESTMTGMQSLVSNFNIFSKVNVPKYLFLLSKNVSSLINFGLTLIVFFIFVGIDGIPFNINFLCLLYPILCLLIFNIGFGLILSAFHVFFKDTQYLYEVFLTLLMYLSAIFYTVDSFENPNLFYFNPVYCYIKYFRTIVLDAKIPDLGLHLVCIFYALLVLAIGSIMYKKYNYKFLYYM